MLDEPTSGVEPLRRARLWDQIREQSQRGVGVLVTTHYMQEAEQCDRLLLMSEGRLVAQGTVADIVDGTTAVSVASDDWSTVFEVLSRNGFAINLDGREVRVIDRRRHAPACGPGRSRDRRHPSPCARDHRGTYDHAGPHVRPRGRRPGDDDTRQRILAAARKLFAESGYERAGMRAIAAEAEVDPALINHYFGSKQGLLTEALRLPVDPAVVLAAVQQAPRDRMGEELVRTLVATWEQPPVRQHFLGMLRTAASHDVAREVMQQTLHDSVQVAVAGLVDDDAPRRSALVITQMAGLAFTRYFLQLPEVTALSTEELVAAIGPTIQRYLTGPVD